MPSSPILCASISDSHKNTEAHFLSPLYHSEGLPQKQGDFCPWLRERLICTGTGNASKDVSLAHLQFECRDMKEEVLSSSHWNPSCEIGQKRSSSSKNPRG